MMDRFALFWLICGLTGVYLAINLGLPHLPKLPVALIYIIQAALWGTLGFVAWRLPSSRIHTKPRVKNDIMMAAAMVGFCQVMLSAIGGLFSGFGKSPSSFAPLGILLNLLYVGSMLLGMELCRAWLVKRLGKDHPTLAITVTGIIFAVASISLSSITGFRFEIQSLNVVGSEWLPLLTESLLASMLALQAGPKASLAYRGLLAAFWWFCPILPDLDWGLKAMIGCIAPVLGMLMVSRLAAQGTRKHQEENSFPLGWIMTATACMLLAWFAVGLFPFKPSVIPTGSMVPVFSPGDIAIIAKTAPDSVKLGDIIEYRTETINIVHRVIEIETNGSFITKGDANDSRDADPVDPRNVTGKVVFRVPKVGWLSLAVKEMFMG